MKERLDKIIENIKEITNNFSTEGIITEIIDLVLAIVLIVLIIT